MFGGQRIAMLPPSGAAQYYVEDMLGSSRVVTTNTGVVCYDADFYPYGGESAIVNNCPAANKYKFEGKERDDESGNDDFGARYYSWRFGRWLSADWSAVPAPVPYANFTNPQTLNLYAMVHDDPETFADLDGHDDWIYGVLYGIREMDGPSPEGLCAHPDRGCSTNPQDNPNPTPAQQPPPKKPTKKQRKTLSKKGLKFIKRHEGYRGNVYKDSAGNSTIGYGHLIKTGEDFSNGIITEEKAAELLSQDTRTAVDAVNNQVAVELSQSQFDALVSFAYNVGGGDRGFGGSTLLDNINAGRDVAEENFTDWNHSGGKVDPGLTNRRTDEWNLYSNGNYGGP